MGTPNPLDHPHAIEFGAWSIDDSGTQLTLHWVDGGNVVTAFVSEEPDAVHIVLTDAPYPRHHEDGIPVVNTLMYVQPQAVVSLSAPLGDREVVDATIGRARPRVRSSSEFAGRYGVGVRGNDRRRELPTKGAAIWTYAPAFRHEFIPPPRERSAGAAIRRWNESRHVKVTDLDGAN